MGSRGFELRTGKRHEVLQAADDDLHHASLPNAGEPLVQDQCEQLHLLEKKEQNDETVVLPLIVQVLAHVDEEVLAEFKGGFPIEVKIGIFCVVEEVALDV